MTKVITLDLSNIYEEERKREKHLKTLCDLNKPATLLQSEVCMALADIITDAPRYATARGIDTIVTDNAGYILRQIANLEAEVQALKEALAN